MARIASTALCGRERQSHVTSPLIRQRSAESTRRPLLRAVSPWVACHGFPIQSVPPEGEGETGENLGEDSPWSPTRLVAFDSDAGEYVIDQLAFEELKLEPAPLFDDTSDVQQLAAGYYQVTVIGELADALGWRV